MAKAVQVIRLCYTVGNVTAVVDASVMLGVQGLKILNMLLKQNRMPEEFDSYSFQSPKP